MSVLLFRRLKRFIFILREVPEALAHLPNAYQRPCYSSDFSTSLPSRSFGIDDFVLLTPATQNDAVNSEAKRQMVLSAMQCAAAAVEK